MHSFGDDASAETEIASVKNCPLAGRNVTQRFTETDFHITVRLWVQGAVYGARLVADFTLGGCAVRNRHVERPVDVLCDQPIAPQLGLGADNEHIARLIQFQHKHGFRRAADTQPLALTNP